MTADGPSTGPGTPEAARGASSTRRPGGAGLAAPATAVLSGTLDVLCRGEPLSVSEIGDHIDLVAELSDAMSALSDRLAHDLGGAEFGSGVATDLRALRDGLAQASSKARRCADALYRAHLDTRPPTEG